MIFSHRVELLTALHRGVKSITEFKGRLENVLEETH